MRNIHGLNEIISPILFISQIIDAGVFNVDVPTTDGYFSDVPREFGPSTNFLSV